MATTDSQIFQITSKAGFSRDGTILDRSSFVDGQWVRFQRGRPRKMGGYKEVATNLDDIVRGSFGFSKGSIEYLYGFGSDHAWLSSTTPDGATSVAALSSLPSLPPGDLYTFQTDSIFDINGSGESKLIVHPAQNLADIADETNTSIYQVVLGTTPAVYTPLDDGTGNPIQVSGGIVVLQPFVFAYGNNGLIKNCNRNNPNDWIISPGNDANEVNVAGTKIVKGLPLRAGSNSPSGLFWSLDSLIRVSRVGGEFRYDPLSSQTTILAPNSAIEYDGVYFWVGTDRFLMFNGTVQEIPNTQNLNWFFDNLNYQHRAKIWALKNTRFGEIWWFFPFGEAEECTHAIIYNIRENVWYDVELARSAGSPTKVFRFPVMYGNELNVNGRYSVFVHEFMKDAVINNQQIALPSFFETSDFGFPTGGATQEQPSGVDRWTRVTKIEPDFIQSGDMSVQVVGETYAAEETVVSDPFLFSPTTGKIDLREQRRQIRLRFESNISGGDFQAGRIILHLEKGDIRG